MNKRIKQLAERAGFLNQEEESIEYFAQLLVQECIDIISPYTIRMSRPGEEYLHPISEIQKHFGVEE